jgi:hypothetical protein
VREIIVQSRPFGSYRRLAVIALAGLFLCFSGCLQEQTNGDVQTFTYPVWVSLVIFLAGGLAAALGYFLLKTHEKPAYILLLVSPVVALFIAPSYFFHKTSVGPEELRTRHGVWGMSGATAKYAELAEIKLTFIASRRSTSYFLDCKTHEEKLISLPLQVDSIKAAAPRFIEYARAKSISLVDHKGDPLLPEMTP